MFRKGAIFCLILSFFSSTVIGPAYAQGVQELPVPGAMVALSPAFEPVLLKGLKVDPQNPFAFDFIVDTGSDPVIANEEKQSQLKAEADTLIKYFMAAMTVPEKDLWVNLSPYEKDRMIAPDLGQTEMGRDMLAQDYVLKQLTASLIYPEKELGKTFWDKVYAKSRELYGTTEIPVNTFNKVWIVADRADVFERGNTAYVTGAHLKVMLAEDYTAIQKQIVKAGDPKAGTPYARSVSEDERGAAGAGPASLASQIVREVILPELEKEVNAGQNFAPLRQMFYAMILASWYKTALKDAVLTQVYGNQGKVSVGVNAMDEGEKDKIFERYLQAYKKGVFNYIKDTAAPDGTSIPRKYFSGGADFAMLGRPGFLHRSQTELPASGLITGKAFKVSGDAAMNSGSSSVPDQTEHPDFGRMFDANALLTFTREDAYIDLHHLGAAIWAGFQSNKAGVKGITIQDKFVLPKAMFYKLDPDGLALPLSQEEISRLPKETGVVHLRLDDKNEAFAFLSGGTIVLATSGFSIAPEQDAGDQQAVIDRQQPLYAKMVLLTDPRQAIRKMLREEFEKKGAVVTEFVGKEEDIVHHIRGIDLVVMDASDGGTEESKDMAIETAKFLSAQGTPVIMFTQQDPTEINGELWRRGITASVKVAVVAKQSGPVNIMWHARRMIEEKDKAMLSLVSRPQLDFMTDVQPRFDAFQKAIEEVERLYQKPYTDKEALALLYQEAWKNSGDQESLWNALVKIEGLQEGFDQYELSLFTPKFGNVVDKEDVPEILEAHMQRSMDQAYARMKVTFDERIKDATDGELEGFYGLFRWAQTEYLRALEDPEDAQIGVMAMSALNAAHDYFRDRALDLAMTSKPGSLKESISKRLAHFRSEGNHAMADNMIVLMAVLVHGNTGPIDLKQYATEDKLQELIEDFASAVRKMGNGPSALRGFLARGYPVVKNVTTLAPAFNLEALVVFSGVRHRDSAMTAIVGRDGLLALPVGARAILFTESEHDKEQHRDRVATVLRTDAAKGTITFAIPMKGWPKDIEEEYFVDEFGGERRLKLIKAIPLSSEDEATWEEGKALLKKIHAEFNRFNEFGRSVSGNFNGLGHLMGGLNSVLYQEYSDVMAMNAMDKDSDEEMLTLLKIIRRQVDKYSDQQARSKILSEAKDFLARYKNVHGDSRDGMKNTYFLSLFIQEVFENDEEYGHFVDHLKVVKGTLDAHSERIKDIISGFYQRDQPDTVRDPAMIGEWRKTRQNFIYKFAWERDNDSVILAVSPDYQDGARDGQIIYEIFPVPWKGQSEQDIMGLYKGHVTLTLKEGVVTGWQSLAISPRREKEMPWLVGFLESKLETLKGKILYHEATFREFVETFAPQEKEIALRVMQMYLTYLAGDLPEFNKASLPDSVDIFLERFTHTFHAKTFSDFRDVAFLMSPLKYQEMVDLSIRNIYTQMTGRLLVEFRDPAMAVTPGGIDLDRAKMQMNIEKEGEGVRMKLNQELVDRIRRQGFDGLEFNIRTIVPIIDLRQFLFA